MNVTIWKVKSFAELSTKELYEILKLRQEVFVVEQNCPYLDADGDDDKAIHIWGEQNQQIVAYCRVFGSGVKYNEPSIGRVLTNSEFRKLKLGRILMKISLEVIESRFKTTSVRISAQDYLINFYQSFGFVDTNKKYLEDDIPHTEMLHN